MNAKHTVILKAFASILIIIPYYGKWPSYFNLYLQGCKNNPWLNILFFTDCTIPEASPENVNFIPSSLRDFSKMATKILKNNIEIERAYKICDFRPCYGLIFQDYLTGYDYWGYGDIDLIYGNLSAYILPKIGEGFDVLSNRSEIMSGSLSIFRNTTAINSLFKKSDFFLKLLRSNKYEGLDETAHDNRTWKGANKLTLPSQSFTYLIAYAQEKGLLKVSFKTTCEEFLGKHDIVRFEENRLTFNGNEISYYHYVCNKNNEWFKFPDWKIVPNKFYITETGFYLSSFGIIKDYIHLWRKSSGYLKNIMFRISKRLKICN